MNKLLSIENTINFQVKVPKNPTTLENLVGLLLAGLLPLVIPISFFVSEISSFEGH